MARTFELFVKRFAVRFGVAAWRVAASYDQQIVREDECGLNEGASADAAGRRYRGSVESLRRSMLRSFSTSHGYESVQQLVIDRTRQGSAISVALDQDAIRTNDALIEQDKVHTGWGEVESGSPWNLSALRFCFDHDFRVDFESALIRDGFEGDARLLWAGVDRTADSLGSSDVSCSDSDDLERAQIAELTRCERDIVAAMVIASLFGPSDYAQFLGHGTGKTPSLEGDGRVARAVKPEAVLRQIIPVGSEPWDYLTMDGPCFKIPCEGRARIGRDVPWCVGGGCVGITSLSKWASKRHCEIFQEKGEWHIRDMGSTNKTLVVMPTGDRAILSGDSFILRRGCIICVAPSRRVSEYGEDIFEWRLGSADECYRFETP